MKRLSKTASGAKQLVPLPDWPRALGVPPAVATLRATKAVFSTDKSSLVARNVATAGGLPARRGQSE